VTPNPTVFLLTPDPAGLAPTDVEFDLVVFDAATLAVRPAQTLARQPLPNTGRLTLPAALREPGTIVTVRCRGLLPALGKSGPWSELKGYANIAAAKR